MFPGGDTSGRLRKSLAKSRVGGVGGEGAGYFDDTGRFILVGRECYTADFSSLSLCYLSRSCVFCGPLHSSSTSE